MGTLQRVFLAKVSCSAQKNGQPGGGEAENVLVELLEPFRVVRPRRQVLHNDLCGRFHADEVGSLPSNEERIDSGFEELHYDVVTHVPPRSFTSALNEEGSCRWF